MIYPIGNVTSKEMDLLIRDIEKLGFICRTDKKGHFVCSPNDEVNLNTMRIEYSDNVKGLAVKNENGAIVFKLSDINGRLDKFER